MASMTAVMIQKRICRRNAAEAASWSVTSTVWSFAFAIAAHMPQPGNEIGCGRSYGQEPGQEYQTRAERAECRCERKFGKHHRRKHDLDKRIGLGNHQRLHRDRLAHDR